MTENTNNHNESPARLTKRALAALKNAQAEAQKYEQDCITPEMLFLGILDLENGVAVSILRDNFHMDFAKLRMYLEEHVSPVIGDVLTLGEKPISERVKTILRRAATEAGMMKVAFVGSEHLLLALLREANSLVAKMFSELYSVTVGDVKNSIESFFDSDGKKESTSKNPLDLNLLEKMFRSSMSMDDSDKSDSSDDENDDDEDDEDEDDNDNDDDNPFNSFEPPPFPPQRPPFDDGVPKEHYNGGPLNAFARNLNEQAKQGKLDPVIGRKEEINRVIQILCRRTKNNPVLIGEAGVGKTAILEGLAQNIVAGKVPAPLLDKVVYMLDLTLMVAGTKYRGQFEERIKDVINEVISRKNVILFIDELHTLVGAGDAEGAMDAANIMKPALSRGEIQCIGATTMNEYRKSIEKDAALERRFQSVIVEPPEPDQAIEILRGLKKKYEDYHHVTYDDAALIAAVKLSVRFISNRFLPDKAIDVIDEAGARARLFSTPQSPDFSDLDSRIGEVVDLKNSAVENQEFESAAKYRDEEAELRAKRKKISDDWQKQLDQIVVHITEKQIAEVVSSLSGVPFSDVQENENERLLKMEQSINDRVIGQQEAISVLAKALRRSKAMLKDPNRPIGSFIFLGPTGVGKTLLAKCVAEVMFGKKDALIQVDMSEFMEKFNVSRLVGSPPGYVGHGEGGELTERVRRHPYSVVLFDEIEKAHPDVMHILLQILEEGKLTDSLGRKIDFRNTVVIMTSNVGAEKLGKGAGMLGFNNSKSAQESTDRQKSMLLDMMKKVFKPEFLNRVDDTIVFRTLDKEDIKKIILLELNQLKARIVEQKQDFSWTDDLIDFLVEKCYQPEYGARPVRRAVEHWVEDALSETLLMSVGKRTFIAYPENGAIHFK